MDRPDPVDSTSRGMARASRVTALGLTFALPALGGYWVDRQWSLGPLGVILGALLGFAAGMVQVFQIAKAAPGGPRDPNRPRR